MAMRIRGNLGLAPWDVLHVGLSRYFSMGFGWVVIGVSFVVLLLWIPLREIPGVGTIANAVIIGAVADFALRVLGKPERLAGCFTITVGGVPLCGLGSELHIWWVLGRGWRVCQGGKAAWR